MRIEYIKGKTTEDKFRSINRLFQYIYPRLNKKTTCVIPPVPIIIECSKADEKGLLCRKIIPITGIINKVFIKIEDLNKEAKFALVINNEFSSTTFKFETRKSSHVEPVNYIINEGDLLTLYTDTPDNFSNVYLSTSINMQLADVNLAVVANESEDGNLMLAAGELDG